MSFTIQINGALPGGVAGQTAQAEQLLAAHIHSFVQGLAGVTSASGTYQHLGSVNLLGPLPPPVSSAPPPHEPIAFPGGGHTGSPPHIGPFPSPGPVATPPHIVRGPFGPPGEPVAHPGYTSQL